MVGSVLVLQVTTTHLNHPLADGRMRITIIYALCMRVGHHRLSRAPSGRYGLNDSISDLAVDRSLQATCHL